MYIIISKNRKNMQITINIAFHFLINAWNMCVNLLSWQWHEMTKKHLICRSLGSRLSVYPRWRGVRSRRAVWSPRPRLQLLHAGEDEDGGAGRHARPGLYATAAGRCLRHLSWEAVCDGAVEFGQKRMRKRPFQVGAGGYTTWTR